jgi:hypothetical protein
MGVWQGLAMDSLKLHLHPPCPLPNPSTLCRRATPETALQLLQGWPTRREGSLRLSSTPFDTPGRTPMGNINVALFSPWVAALLPAYEKRLFGHMINLQSG